jgi:hypothetical protein
MSTAHHMALMLGCQHWPAFDFCDERQLSVENRLRNEVQQLGCAPSTSSATRGIAATDASEKDSKRILGTTKPAGDWLGQTNTLSLMEFVDKFLSNAKLTPRPARSAVLR